MHKKIVFAVMAVIAIPLAVFAAGNLSYEAYKSDAMISFNDMDVNFQLPVVTINGNTYIPLREAAEKAGIVVGWNGDEQRIRLTHNIQNIDAKEAFQNLFGFALPETAEVLNYEYYNIEVFEGEPEQHFAAKISFQERDLEYLKNQFSGWGEDFDAGNMIGVHTGFVTIFNKKYEWWDLADTNEVLYTYWIWQKGEYVRTITSRAFITNPSDGQYYLYISRY